MSGAIVPDDWDGSTYKCYKIRWPNSNLYSAILLGAISRPSFPSYWDPDTGDVDEAVEAIESSYDQTIPDFWIEDCEDTVLMTKGFRVQNNSVQSIPAVTWTKVIFNTFVWNKQPTTWNMSENAQDMTIPASAGIWQYNAGLVVSAATRILLSIRLNNYYVIAYSGNSAIQRLLLSTAWDVDATWTWLNLWVYTDIAVDILSVDDATPWFEGHLIKPVEES